MEGWRPCGVQDKKIPKEQEIIESVYKRSLHSYTFCKSATKVSATSVDFMWTMLYCTPCAMSSGNFCPWQTPWTIIVPSGPHCLPGNIPNYSLTEKAVLCSQHPSLPGFLYTQCLMFSGSCNSRVPFSPQWPMILRSYIPRALCSLWFPIYEGPSVPRDQHSQGPLFPVLIFPGFYISRVSSAVHIQGSYKPLPRDQYS